MFLKKIVLFFLFILFFYNNVFALGFYNPFDLFKSVLDRSYQNVCDINPYYCTLAKFFFPGPKFQEEIVVVDGGEDLENEEFSSQKGGINELNRLEGIIALPNEKNIDSEKSIEDLIKESDEKYREPSKDEIKKYEEETGKVFSPQTQAEQAQNFISPQQLQSLYNQDPFLKYYSDNPSTRDGQTMPEGSGYVSMNQGSFTKPVGSSGELDSRIFTKIEADGWLHTNSSIFGLNANTAKDQTILPKYGGLTAMSSFARAPIRVTNTHTCIVSFPREVINYYYGKVNWSDGKSIASMYKKIAGTRVEVVNLSNNKCAVAPLWEIGPGHGEGLKHGFGIDLTYCVYVTMLKLNEVKGAKKVKYRPVPTGKTGCEGYDGKVAPVDIQRK